jgi:chemotaxis protein histidine kinase CheA
MSAPTDDARAEKVAMARARMAELSAKFIERTKREIAAMRDALARARTGDLAALGEIRHFAHRMTGTGATLGFESLSDRAHVIEASVDALTAGAAPEPGALARLESDIGALDVELRRLDAR